MLENTLFSSGFCSFCSCPCTPCVPNTYSNQLSPNPQPCLLRLAELAFIKTSSFPELLFIQPVAGVQFPFLALTCGLGWTLSQADNCLVSLLVSHKGMGEPTGRMLQPGLAGFSMPMEEAVCNGSPSWPALLLFPVLYAWEKPFRQGAVCQQLFILCVVLISVSSYFCTCCVYRRIHRKACPGQLG